MKRVCVALIVVAQAVCSHGSSAEEVTNSVGYQFKYERYDSQGGALYRSDGKNSYCNDLVQSVFVDSKGWVFAGTQNGLAVYDGKQWTKRTFKIKGLSLSGRIALGLLRITECGPEKIAEGPPGTIWLGGSGCGVWRFRDGRYDEISSSPFSSYLGMAVDNGGSLWVVTKQFVYKYDGQAWSTVLCPYVGKLASIEAPGLYGIAIETNGHVWIGGTVYGTPKAPWENEVAVWVVDQKHKKRGDGPPMAPLFEFDGKRWQAFGAPHGLGMQEHGGAIPEFNGQGRIIAKTGQGYYVREGEIWKPMNEADVYAGKRWVLRGHDDRIPPEYFAELLFRDGESLVQVRPTDHQTGEVMDLGSEPLGVLRIAEDHERGCIWLGTMHGLYRIWREKEGR